MRAELIAEARNHFAVALTVPLHCDAVILFVEEAPGTDFRVERRFRFSRSEGEDREHANG